MRKVFPTIIAMLACSPVSALADVKSAAPDSFLIEQRFVIRATAARVWDSVLHPGRWWPADHTWSGKRENLSLEPSIGGCFCERWDGNAVEHGRVVMLMPGKLLRLDAALGPLQELAVSGVITIALAEKDGATTVTMTHRVSGDATQKLDALAPVVDKVNAMQFGGLVADAESNARP